MRYVIADARKGMNENLHLVEHAIDYHREFGEGIVGVPMRQSFPQLAGDDALHPLIDFHDTIAGTSAQRHTDSEAKKHGGNQTKRKRPANDACDLPDFFDIPSNQQHIAVRQTSRDQADHLFLPTTFVDPFDHGALYRIIGLEIGWQAFQVTRDPASVRAKQSCELNAARILLQMLIDRVQPPLGRQVGEHADLRGDHAVGSRRQVIFRFQINKPEHRNDKRRKYAGHQKGPAQRRQARELGQLHKIIPPKEYGGVLRFCLLWRLLARLRPRGPTTSSTWVPPLAFDSLGWRLPGPLLAPAPHVSLIRSRPRLDPTEVDSNVVLVWGAAYLGLALGANPIGAGGYVMLWRRSPSHLPVSPQFPSRAVARQLIKVGPAKGLARKAIAPAFSTRARTLSSGKAVMKMNGTREPWARISVCSSTPLIVGICTSAITHEVSFKWADCKNSSADANVCTVNPCDLRRLLVAARTDASSSMTEIIESVDKEVLPEAAKALALAPPPSRKMDR